MRKALLFLLIITSTLLYGAGVDDAKGYSKSSILQWTAAMSVIDNINWSGDEKILDIGCGDGKITAHIAENCTKSAVVGIDVSESMIRFASTHYNQQKHNNLIFFQADAAHLPFEQQFDVAVSFSTLHWVLDQESALESIYRALVPGGKTYIVTYAPAPMNTVRMGESLMATEKWASFFPDYTRLRVYFTQQEYADLMCKAGFTDIVVTSEWNHTIYANREELAGMVSPLLNCTKHLSPELRQDFLNDMINMIISLAKPTDDGTIIFEFQLLHASGTKP